jgi:hypothetical protein
MLRTVLILGDAVCDHNLYRGNRQTADSTEDLGVRYVATGGGALLLGNIIREAMRDLAGWSIFLGVESDHTALPQSRHSYCLWEPQLSNPDEEDKKKHLVVWRAVDPLLGYGHPASEEPNEKDELRARPGGPSEILVIDDAGLGFRDGAYRRLWPFGTSTPNEMPKWVVLKETGWSGVGDLWRDVFQRFGDRLVLVVSADDLRRRDVRIGQGLSWEATAQDLLSEIQNNPLLKSFSDARHVIVTFGSDAALWVDNKAPESMPMLVFDAARAEGEWAQRQGKGGAFGFLSSFTAAVVRELARAEADPDFEAALFSGLCASRECRRLGHGQVYLKVKQSDGTEKSAPNPSLGFPFKEIGNSISAPQHAFVSAPIPTGISSRGEWMMLDEWHVHAQGGGSPRPHFEAALAVAILGPGALERFPVAAFGKLQTVDRKEIESLRTFRQLITAYETKGAQKKPLSLGVFGPPGAGKSFGVIQIAKAVLGSKDEDILTFNLSQFNEPSDLNGALHQVRDRVLSGKTPVVFWDEFDSQGYKWLQYLLAPMQDGKFQDGPITHPIGKCIFVFAGATSATFDAFGPLNPDDFSREEKDKLPDRLRHIEQQWLDFVLKKGPDFKSRLVAYLNVLGPNPRRYWTKEAGERRWQDDSTDVCYPIRRALFMRSQFDLKDGARLHLDMGVVQALLEIPLYKSGSRSLEFLCGHIRENPAGAPTRSALPGLQLLDLHVDATAFWEICNRDTAFVAAAPKLARGLHEEYCKNLKPEERNRRNAVPWEKLSEDARASNVAQAARIPRILALAGLRVVEGEPLAPDEKQSVRQTFREHAEVLAEAEHSYWMVERMLAGWRYGRKRDDDNKRHNLLIPYAQLPQVQREKDRRLVRGQDSESETKDYIALVQQIGFRIEPIPGTLHTH